MKKNEKKVLPFPPPPRESSDRTIICEIGTDRFAIHVTFEDLPPAPLTPPPPVPLLKPPTKKRKRVE